MNIETGKRKIFINLFYSATLVAVVFLLYSKNLSGFWRADDPQILLQALKYSWWEYFFIPDVWQTLSVANLTPWVTFSFDLDLLLFGIKPFGFYLHHLASVAAVAVATFFLLFLWVDKHWAFLGALLFLVGAPMETVTHNLMTRHYIEGLLFSILSVYCFMRYTTNQRYGFIVGSLIFYALAISAKEIYVPLVILLLFMQRENLFLHFKRTLPSILPFVLIVILYVIWRGYMLSSVVGGYAGGSDYFSFAYWAFVLTSFGRIPLLLVGEYYFLFIGLFLVVMLKFFLFYKDKIVLSFLCLLLVLLPLSPLAKYPGIASPDRYLLLGWYFLSISFTYFVTHIASLGKKALCFVVPACGLMFMIIFSHTQAIARNLDRIALESDVQMRFAWENDNRFSFIPTEVITRSFWTLTGLYDIKTFLNDGASSPGVIVDDMFLQYEEKLFEYNADCRCMQDIAGQVPQRMIQAKKHLREHAPLALDIRNENGFVTWTFGPHGTGTYRLVSQRAGSIVLPTTGLLKANIKETISFYLRYVSPDGWTTYSPLITLSANGSPVQWARTDQE